ncbi:MAG: hypothetical protein SF052_13105 [Bacteroidia bacterium]|nr:hypothetical protein [Bacteroidia bacterium]
MSRCFNPYITCGLSLLGVLTHFLSFAQQPTYRLGLGISGGMSAGWWIFDKGFNDTLPDWHEGYDRTHLTVLIRSEFTLSFRNAKGFAELGGGFRALQDNIMISSADRRRTGTRYRISSGRAVPVFAFYLTGGYHLFQKKSFSFTPTLSAGTFFLTTNHPQKAYFKNRFFYDVGVSHIFYLSERWDFSVFPHYSQMIITTTREANKGSGHAIRTVGFLFGFRLWII